MGVCVFTRGGVFLTYPAKASLGLVGEKQQQTGWAEVSSTFCGWEGSFTDQTHTRPHREREDCQGTDGQAASRSDTLADRQARHGPSGYQG